MIGRIAMLSVVGWLIGAAGCEPPESAQECEESPQGPCDEIVSCCDLVLSEDPQGASPAGELCLTDQLDALAETEKLNPDNSLCEAMALQMPYQEACFSCSAEETQTEDSVEGP